MSLTLRNQDINLPRISLLVLDLERLQLRGSARMVIKTRRSMMGVLKLCIRNNQR